MKLPRLVDRRKRLVNQGKVTRLSSRILGLTIVSFLLGTTFFSLSFAAPKAPWNTTASTNCPGQGVASDMTEVDGLVYLLDSGTSFYRFDPVTEACTQLANFPVSIATNDRLVAVDSDNIYAYHGSNNGLVFHYIISENRWISMTRAVLDDGTPVSNSGATQNNGNSIVPFNNELYVLAGNGTTFQSYDPVANTWTSRASTPASVNDGAAMAVAGSSIYAFRGANTTDFWEFNGTSWNNTIAQAPNTVEAGGALATVGNTVYALRGNNSKEFWSYDTVGDSWNTSLPDTPDYVQGGGSLVTIGTDIYALQGNNAQNFWKYDTVGGSWDDSLAIFPEQIFGIYGGGALTTDGTDIYVTMGGNYTIFYKYTVGTDTWTRLDNVPYGVGGDRTTAEGGLAFLNNVIYCVTGDGITGTAFNAVGVIWRYPLTGVNANTWPVEYQFSTPSNSTYGGSLVHPGASAVDATGDFFYMLKGTVSSSFWKFSHAFQTFITASRSFHDGTETELISQDAAGTTVSEGSGSSLVIINGEVYMVQGGGSNVFMKYIPSTNQWIRLSNAPDNLSSSTAMTASDNDTIWVVHNDDTFKYIISQDQWYAGAPLATDDSGRVYSTKTFADQNFGSRIVPDGNGGFFMFPGGNALFTHWNDDNNTWVVLPSLPSNTSIGADMVNTGTKIYAVRGSNTRNFYEYDIDSNTWSTLTDVPSTGTINEGSGLAYPGSGDFIYLTIGDLTQEFWRYSISGDSWTQLADTPATVRGGGDLVILGNYAYAFRGNNTTTFWRYDITQTPGSDAWNTGLDPADAPAGVQAGGHLTTDGTDIYATRGSDTAEFWKYDVAFDTWDSHLDVVPVNVGFANTTQDYGDMTYDPVTGDIFVINGEGENGAPLSGEAGPFYRYKLSAGAGQFTWPVVDALPPNPGNSFRGAGFAYPGIGNLLYLTTATNFWTFHVGAEEWNAFPKAVLDNGDPISQDGLDMEGRSSSIHYQNGLFYVVPGVGTNFQSYNPTTNEWKQLNDVPLTSGATFGVVETQMIEDPNDSDKIYLFVDEGNTLLKNYWYSYDITDDEWTILASPDMDPGCGNITYPGAGDWIYISACDSPPMQHSTWRYSMSKDLWINHDLPRFDGNVSGSGPTPEPLADPTDLNLAQNSGGEEVITVNGDLFILANSNEMWSFDPTTNTWTQYADTPESQLVSALVYPGGEKIYALFNRNTNFYEYCLPGSGGCTPDTWTLVTNTFPAGTGNDSGSFESTNWVDEADLFYPGSGDYIYGLVGGVSNDLLGFCFQDTGSGCTVDTWTKIGEKLDADPNTAGYQYARYTDMASIDGNIIYMGTIGYEHVQAYNIGSNSWSYSTDAPFNFGSAASFTSDGNYLWVAQGGNSGKMWRFDPGGSGWTDADFADLPGEDTDLGTTSGGWPTGGMIYDAASDEVWFTSGVARGPESAFSHSARGAFLWRYKIDPETCDGSGENPGTGSNPCNGYNDWPYYAVPADNNQGQYRPTALESTGTDNYIYELVGQYTRSFVRYTIEDRNGTPDVTAADPGAGTWTSMPPTPYPTNGPLMQYANGYFYVVRGYFSKSFLRYDFTETNPASLLTNEISSDNPATWATITDGTFTITIDGTAYDIDGPLDLGVDFSSVTSMPDVATILQQAIRDETSSTETVTYCDDLGTINDRGYFLFRSATAPGGGGSISTLGRLTGVGTDISGASSQGTPPVTLNGSGGHVRTEKTSGDWEYCGAGPVINLPVTIGDSSAGSRAGNMEYVPSLDEMWVAHNSGDGGNSDNDDTGLLWRYDLSTNEWPYIPAPPNPPGAFEGGGDLTVYDNDTLYALRGGNTNNFFEFDITGNSWINHTSTDPTPETVVAGGSLTSDGTLVYATRGNDTGDFWTYDPAAPSGSRWNSGGAPAQAPIHMGSTSGTDSKGKIRYDNNSVWVTTGSGQNGIVDNENSSLLNRYDTVADEWPAITDPDNPDQLQTDWRGGSDLTSWNGTDLYALRGYFSAGNNFFHYDVLTDVWSQLADLPAPDPAINTADGGNLEVVSDDTIYALRGFATDEFYRYDISGDTWESDPIQDFPVNVGTTSNNNDRGDLTFVSSENILFGMPGSGSTIYKLDLNTRITVQQVNGGVNPEANTPFNMTIQASDANGDPVVVGSDVDATITLETGNGNFGGTLTGTILSGNSQGTITGITYDLPESGVSVRITDTSASPTLLESVSDIFTVDAATPTITNITPAIGTTMGGTEVTITGTNFANVTTVTFDGIDALQVIFDSDTQIRAITPQSSPSGSTGAVDVVVANPGPKTATEVGGFTYAAPTVTNINPNSGSTAGGNSATITGTYFGPSYYTLDVDIDNSGVALTDYQVSFELDTATLIAEGKMRSDCGDIRVFDSDQVTPLPYWVESGSCNNSVTRVWTKVDLAVGPSTKTIYATYGVPTLTSDAQNGEDIFVFFDDFDGSSLDTSKWTGDTAQFSVGNGILENTDNNNYRLSSIDTFSGDIILEVKNIANTGPGNGFMPAGFFSATSNGIGYLLHSGTDYYRDDSSFISIGGNFLDVGYDIIYRFVASGSNVDISAQNISGTTTYHSATVPNTISNETISIGQRYDNGIYNQAYDADWDWIFVRQYAATPPTVTNGTETGQELTVAFGTNSPLTLRRVSESELTVTVPPSTTGGGAVDLIVTNGDSTSDTLTNGYTYNLPTVTDITPNAGPLAGGTDVVITGTFFSEGGYNRTITINNPSGGTLTNTAVPIILDTASLITATKMKSDCGDIRLEETDGETALSYWIEDCNSNDTIVWVLVPNIPIAGKDIRMTYGNSSLTSQSSLANVFPTLASNTEFWIRANEGTDATNNADPVTTWNDQSGNGNTITTNNSDPTFVTNTLNGLPVVRFNGSNQSMGRTGFTGLPTGAAVRTIFNVSQYRSIGFGGFAYGTATTDGVFGNVVGSNGNFYIQGWGSGNDFDSGTTANGAGWNLHTSVFGGNGANQLQQFVNGSLVSQHTTTAYNTGTTEIEIGREMDNSPYVNMDMAEVIVFSNDLSTTEREEVERYLNTKYDLYGSNPDTTVGAENGVGDTQINVTFDGIDATNVNFVNSTTVNATTPAHSAGAVDVAVINPNTDAGTLPGGYTYQAAPTISDINPSAGTNGESNLTVTITGTGFLSGISARLEKTGQSNISCTNIQNFSATSFDCDLDLTGAVLGDWDVVVENLDTQSATLVNGFTVSVAPPSIISINPDNGPEAGGTNVTITGSNFIGKGYIRPVDITNSSASILSDYQVSFTLDTATLITNSKMRSDCGDLRVKDTNGVSDIDYWIEDGTCDTGSTIVWAEVPIIAATPSTTTIYVMYGDTALTDAGSTANTFVDEIDSSALIAHWKLDESSGTNAPDTSGNGLDGTAFNTPTWSAGNFNNGIELNGSNQYIDIPYNAQLAPTTEISFGAWAYQADWATATANMKVLSKTETGGYQIGMNDSVADSIEALVYANGTYHRATATRSTLSAGWHHFMGTFDGQFMRLYIDGALEDTVDLGGTYPVSYSNNNSLLIGAEPNGGSTATGQYYNSRLDEVMVLNRALSDTEVANIANNYGHSTTNYPNSLLVRKWEPSVTPNLEAVSTGAPGTETTVPEITFDGIAATNIVYVNSTTLTADTPAHAAGAVDVVVTNPDSVSDTLTNGFSYVGTPDETASTFTPSAAAVVANGVTESILTATVNDAGINPVPGQVVTVAHTAGTGTPDIQAVNCAQADVGSVTKGTTNSSGQACFRVRSTDVTSPGSDTFTATITSIPAAITQTADVEFTLDYADQYDSTFTSAPGTIAADGVETSTLTATIVDTLGRTISGLTINAGDDTGGNVVYDPIGQSEATNGSGVADFDVSSTTAGIATFTASFNANHYDKTSYTETASPTFVNDYAGTAATLIAGSQGDNVEATTTLPFDFELYGVQITAGNNIYVCSNGFISFASTGCPASGSLSNAIAGFFHDLDTTSGGIYREVASDNNSVRFLFDTIDVGTSNPVVFEIILTRSNRIEFHYFVNSGLSGRIGLYDNSVSSAPDDASGFDNSVFGNTAATKFENSTIAGAVDLTQTSQVEFTAGAVVPGNSTVEAAPTAVLANGIETSTITVTLRDQFNNPVAGRTVEVSDDQIAGQVEYVGEATPPPYPNDVTDASGQVTFDVRSTAIDTATFTATDITSGSTVIGTTQVEFTCEIGANQQCVQVLIEESPGVLAITAPDDFAFPSLESAITAVNSFSIDSLTPYTTNVNDVVTVTDTENNGGFTLQLQSSVFADPPLCDPPSPTCHQIPLTGLYTATKASSTGGDQDSGVEYDSGYAGVKNITAAQNTAGAFTSESTFTADGDNLDAVIDLMTAPVTIAEGGRDGQFKQNVQYLLQIPAYQDLGSYQVTLTFDLTRTAPI